MGIDKAQVYPHDVVMKYTFLPLVPRFVLPNHITIIRFLLTPFVAWLLLEENYSWGIALFFVAAFTDALDGSLARIRNQITAWGQTYDPVADKILIGSAVIILASKHFFYTIIIMLAIDFSFIAAGWVWKAKGLEIKANVWGKIKMGLQVTGVFLLMVAIMSGAPIFLAYSYAAFCLAIVFALISFATHGI